MNKIFIWIGIVFLAASACSKSDKHAGGKQCNYALFAFKRVGSGVYKIVSIDTGTGKSIDNLPFPEVYGVEGFLDNDSKCYYLLETDSSGLLTLHKFDLVNKTSTIYKGRNWGDEKISPFTLTYSVVTSKFYFLYSYVIGSYYGWSFYEMNIMDNSFNDKEIALSPVPDGMFSPLIANVNTGDIYFRSRPFPFALFRADTRSMQTERITDKSYLDHMVFSRNSGLLYGVSPSATKPDNFSYQDPKTGTISKIALMPSISEKYGCGTFDNCKNQYIFQNGGTDTVVDIYWLDAKDGSVRKHLTARDAYVGLICVNLD